MTPLVVGFLLGLAGSLHCVAMCGPLMVGWRQHAGDAGSLALYHVGRIALYALLGACAGSAGQAFAAGGFARALSIAAGLTLIAMAVGRTGVSLSPLVAGMARWIGRRLGAAQKTRTTHPFLGALAAGALNGLLPCSLVYAAVTGAAGLAHPGAGAAGMLAFGLGTTPLLAGVWWSSATWSVWARTRTRYAAPLALAVTGALLIMRGARAPHVHATSTPSTPVAAMQHQAH